MDSFSSVSAAVAAPLALLQQDPQAARQRLAEARTDIAQENAAARDGVARGVRRISENGLEALEQRTQSLFRALRRLTEGQQGLGVGIAVAPGQQREAQSTAFRLDYAAEARFGAGVARERLEIASFRTPEASFEGIALERSLSDGTSTLSREYVFGRLTDDGLTDGGLTAEGAFDGIRGSDAADVLGAAEADALSGGTFGALGANGTIDLGAGNDLLTLTGSLSGVAFDRIDLGSGDDAILGNLRFAGQVDAGAGNDRVALNVEIDAQVDGGEGNDVISLNSQLAATGRGGAGDDAISIAAALAEARGGEGNDAIAVAAAEAQVFGGEGNDAIAVAAGLATVDGGAGNDSIAVQAGEAERVSGGDGDDVISVRADTAGEVSGGEGDDVISVSGGDFARVSGGTGDDVLLVSAANATLSFQQGDGNDVLRVDEGSTVVIETDGPASFTRQSDGSQLLELASGDTIRIEGAGQVQLATQGGAPQPFYISSLDARF